MSFMSHFRLLATTAITCAATAAAAQVPLDRADPSVQQQSLPIPQEQAPEPRALPITPTPEAPTARPLTTAPISVRNIEISGNAVIEASVFADILSAYTDRPLERVDLERLAREVGDRARERGYVLATASVDTSGLPATLRVQLDEGRIDAVRILGSSNAAAEAILQRLVTGQPVRKEELERAILLAGDVPGFSIDSSRLIREGGFGILLVEASIKRVAVYGQIENRGSPEIGPIRSTVLGSYRGAFRSGDELGLIAANTPLSPREFWFLQGRYGAPVDNRGGTLSTAVSYGRTNPGGSIRALDVVGHSYDLRVIYQHPIQRTRSASLWVAGEFRAAVSDQSLSGTRIREDRLSTVTASLIGEAQLLGGIGRAQGDLAIGLPLDGTTREGDRLASRLDGSARFAAAHATLDWITPLLEQTSLRLSAEGQLASRPLLASMELGAGGPAFGRAYDYGERTGDQGVLGSAELRWDVATKPIGPLRRIQLFSFVDGGYVDNLRDGIGGGTLASSGGGVRATLFGVDVGAEIALPLNADRLDSGRRNPRFSGRLAKSF